MVNVLLASEVVTSMPWLAIAREIGVLAALAGFFTWQSWRREERMSGRVTHLENFIQEKLLTTIETSLTHMNENTDVLRSYSENMAKFMEKLSTRPCLYEEMVKTLTEQGYDIIKKEEHD